MISEIGNQKSLVSQKPKKGTVSRKINVLNVFKNWVKIRENFYCIRQHFFSDLDKNNFLKGKDRNQIEIC